MKNDIPADLQELVSGLDDEIPLIDDGMLPMTRAGVVDYSQQIAPNPEDADLKALFSPNIVKPLTPQEEEDVEFTKMMDSMRIEPLTAKEKAREAFTVELKKLFTKMARVFTPQRFAQEVEKTRSLLKRVLVEAAGDAR